GCTAQRYRLSGTGSAVPAQRYRLSGTGSAVPAQRYRLSGTGSAVQGGEPGQRLLQHLGPLAEGKPYLGAARLAVVIEHRARDGDDTGPLRQPGTELDAVRLPDGADVGRDEVGPVRRVHLESQLGQAAAKQVALHPQVVAQGGEVGVRLPERLGDRVLERPAA